MPGNMSFREPQDRSDSVTFLSVTFFFFDGNLYLTLLMRECQSRESLHQD